MRILSPWFVAQWRGRVLNIHPSLLPKYRGLDTHARAIAAGESMSGCSVHVLTEELDAGEVLGRAEVAIEPDDTPASLEARVLAAEHALYPDPREVRQPMSELLQKVRERALQLPETEERLSHGQPTFFVAGKQFAQFRDNHHGDRKIVVCVRVSSLDEQAMLLEASPEIYAKPAYLRTWVSINLGGDRRRLGPRRRSHRAELGACGTARTVGSWRAMNDEERKRRRWINLGELIALAALVVSATGVWIAWRSSTQDKPTRIVEQRSSVPLALRGTAETDGRTLTIMPADPAHGLEFLEVTIKGARPIDVGSDGKLMASDVQAALKEREKEPKDVALTLPVRIEARYVEQGADRRGAGSYLLRYKWQGGGLFGGRSLHLLGLSRG